MIWPPSGGRRRDLLDAEQILAATEGVSTADDRSISKLEKIADESSTARMSARADGSTLPPDRTITVAPGGVAPRRYAASATAPLGSLTRWAFTASSRTAARISFSDTVIMPSSTFCRCAKVSADGCERRPSAMVRLRSSMDQSTRSPRRGPRRCRRRARARPRRPWRSGICALIAVPTPDARPPPLTGISTFSHIRQVVGDLQADRALPRDHIRMVEGRYQHTARLLEQLGGDLFALTGAAQHHVCAVVTGGLHLDERCLTRHDDVRLDPKRGGRVGDRLGVIAARIRDHAPGAIRFRSNFPTALNAPRILNAPIGCRFSGLIHSGRSPSAHRAGISGVRTTASLIRSAAA